MFRSIAKLLQIIAQTAPIAAKKLAIPASILVLHQPILFSSSVFCRQSEESLHNTITLLQDSIITIEKNGDVVGYAYCFADNLLISTSQQMIDKTPNQRQNYEFYQGRTKIKGTFKIIGHFQNSTFIERTDSDTLKPLPAWNQTEPFQISQVEIYLKKSYPSISHGYLVAQDAGYGVADGKGQVGSLVLKNNKTLGIVTQIGTDNYSGFLRFIQTKHFRRIVKYLKGHKMHLGVSARALQGRQGIQIMRIAPSSPFRNELAMGDFITKVNGQKVSSAQDLQRICILQEGPLTLQVQREGGQQKLKVNIN